MFLATLTVLRGPGQVLRTLTLYRDFSNVSFHDHTGAIGSGDEDLGDEVPFLSHRTELPAWLITTDVDLITG